MPRGSVPFLPLQITLYRIAFAQNAAGVLKGVSSPEGRFHHNGQPALYASPTPEGAAIAIDIYLKRGDAARVMIPLLLDSDKMVDLRDPETCDALRIAPEWPSIPWADERAAGRSATSWKASDAVREAGADGMIYTSRRAPERWHVAMFSWNKPGRATIAVAGPAVAWAPARPV